MTVGRIVEKARDDRGSASLMFVLLAVGLLFAVTMVVDGGRRLNAVRDARHLSDNAARIGAQAIDTDSSREGKPVVDPARAAAAVDAYASHWSNAGVVRSMTLIEPSGAGGPGSDRVVVEVVLEPVAGLIIDTGPVTVRSSALTDDGVVD